MKDRVVTEYELTDLLYYSSPIKIQFHMCCWVYFLLHLNNVTVQIDQ